LYHLSKKTQDSFFQIEETNSQVFSDANEKIMNSLE